MAAARLYQRLDTGGTAGIVSYNMWHSAGTDGLEADGLDGALCLGGYSSDLIWTGYEMSGNDTSAEHAASYRESNSLCLWSLNFRGRASIRHCRSNSLCLWSQAAAFTGISSGCSDAVSRVQQRTGSIGKAGTAA